MLCGMDKSCPATLGGLDKVLGLSSVRLCSLVSRYWRLHQRVNVNCQSFYLKKAGVASRKIIVLRFKNSFTLHWFLLRKYSLCK